MIRKTIYDLQTRAVWPGELSALGKGDAAMAERTKAAAKKATAASGKKSAATSAKKTAAKKVAKKVPAPRKKADAVNTGALVVLPGEDPWTKREIAEVQTFLQDEATRLSDEISDAEADIADMLRDSNDAGGEDQADTGSKTFSREHEMSLAASHREMLQQTHRALSNIETETYGVCDNCGNPVGKARLQAFPRATLCMTCKTREERR